MLPGKSHIGGEGRRFSSNAGLLLRLVACLLALTATSATYIPVNNNVAPQMVPDNKVNSVDVESRDSASRKHRAFFKDDAEIFRYLKGQGRQLMLWRCRNAIQQYWKNRPLPFIDLYCDVIGTVQTGTWSHRGRNIVAAPGSAGSDIRPNYHKHLRHQSTVSASGQTDPSSSSSSRYRYTISTHQEEDGRYYSAWLDFQLRIYNATKRDSGIYRFRVVGPGGADHDEQAVYVDISPAAILQPARTVGNGSVDASVPATAVLTKKGHSAGGSKSKSKQQERQRRRRNELKRRQSMTTASSAGIDNNGNN